MEAKKALVDYINSTLRSSFSPPKKERPNLAGFGISHEKFINIRRNRSIVRDIMRNNAILKFATVLLLLTGLCQGGYDQSGGTGAENLSMAEFASLGSGSQTEGAVLIAGAPQDVATDLGTELAIYSDRAPPSTELRKLQSLDLALYPPTYIYFYGGYLGWNDFKTTFSPSSAGLWIERAAGWSWYATMPLGGWAHELLYVPVASDRKSVV